MEINMEKKPLKYFIMELAQLCTVHSNKKIDTDNENRFVKLMHAEPLKITSYHIFTNIRCFIFGLASLYEN